MSNKGGYITIRDIVDSWILKRGKTIHAKYRVYPLVFEAVRELALTSMPLLNMKLLTRPSGQHWFDLPSGYSAYVSLHKPSGGVWAKVQVTDNIVPFPAYDGITDLGSGFGAEMMEGQQVNRDAIVSVPPEFLGDEFLPEQFNTGYKTANGYSEYFTHCPSDGVVFSETTGQIFTGSGYQSDVLMLVYVGIGQLDSMTNVPVSAQAVLEAYIDWKYALNKRNGIGEAREYRALYERQHKIYRARRYAIGADDIAKIRRENNGAWVSGVKYNQYYDI